MQPARGVHARQGCLHRTGSWWRHRLGSTLARRSRGAQERVLVRGGEDVDAELGGDLVADGDSPDAVAVDVQSRREDGHATLAGDDGEDPPLTPLLAGT